MITVTRATAPLAEDYLALVRQILDARQFTNHGPMVSRLERTLSTFLSSK